MGCACPAEEVSQQQLIPLATDQLTCHLDCICDQDDESESIDHTIRSVNNLEEQYECNSKNQGCDYDDTTSVKEECDCKPFCSCNRVESVRSNSVKSCEQHLINQQTLFDSKNDSKNCECSTICYCESKGSTSCLCCFCNRITSTFADLDQVDNVSSGMKLLKQCECESLCECENSDRFSVDYMKELDDLRQKTEDVNVSSCKLEQLKETFRESDIVSEPGCDFFKRLKSETLGEIGERKMHSYFYYIGVYTSVCT